VIGCVPGEGEGEHLLRQHTPPPMPVPLPPPLPHAVHRDAPNGIVSRASTLRNEISKYIARVPASYVAPHAELRPHLLNLDGVCEYCRRRPATTVDHFWPLVVQRRPTGYCNDLWNSVPACQGCNSSKGNRDATAWLRSSAPSNPLAAAHAHAWTPLDRARLLAKFDAYAAVSWVLCRRVHIDADLYCVIDAAVDRSLERIARAVHAMAQRSVAYSHARPERPLRPAEPPPKGRGRVSVGVSVSGRVRPGARDRERPTPPAEAQPLRPPLRRSARVAAAMTARGQ
jgi:hypothetical protein